jgi:tetratricopeptide (TPR) repeat protein
MKRTLVGPGAKGRVAVVAVLAATLLVAASAPAAPVGCTATQGQAYIDGGRYGLAIKEFTCVIDAQPTEVEGYRGRIEAELLVGRFSDAVRDYARVTAFVEPVHPRAEKLISDGYAKRLAADPLNRPALTGASFARWWFFDYAGAIPLVNQLLDENENDLYANLFRGSNRVLGGIEQGKGVEDLDRAIKLDKNSADVRYLVADAYTYGLPDPERALAEATRALNRGLDTPRIHAILAAAYNALGDTAAGATHIERHIELVTTELVHTAPLAVGDSISLDLVPGRTYEIPIAATAGERIAISTSSNNLWDSIAVLYGPDGAPIVGSDDDNEYFAALDLVAEATGTYLAQVTSFEAVSTGKLVVTRD